MRKNTYFLFFVLFLFLSPPSLFAATHDWGTTGVADTSKVEGILQLTDNTADITLGMNSIFLTSPWNRDGSWIVYKFFDSSTGSGIYKIHAASGYSKCLTDNFLNPSESVQDPSFGTDNRIYFGKNTSTDHEIWRMNSDGTNKENLTLKHGGSDEQYVKVSPDAQWIAFFHNNGIWVAKSDGSSISPTPVSGATLVNSPQYSWSPDSQWLAYQGLEGGQKWIYKVRVDGTDNQSLTKLDEMINPQSHLWPSWSPDGEKIAYLWSGDGLVEHVDSINIITEEGQPIQTNLDSAVRLLTDYTIGISGPFSWSPDSQWITYIKQGGGDKAIFMTNVEDPGQKAQLTADYADYTPIWSPAGNQILFADAGPG